MLFSNWAERWKKKGHARDETDMKYRAIKQALRHRGLGGSQAFHQLDTAGVRKREEAHRRRHQHQHQHQPVTAAAAGDIAAGTQPPQSPGIPDAAGHGAAGAVGGTAGAGAGAGDLSSSPAGTAGILHYIYKVRDQT